MSESTSITPTFRGEFYFLIAKFLEDGPCKESAELLRKQITEKALVPPRFDWTGGSHIKTFRDIEEEFGFIAPEYLLKRCFELCSAIGDPKGPQTRSLVQKSVKSKRSLFRIGQLEGSVVHNLFKSSIGSVTPAKTWHERYLCSKIKYLRRNLGHLSSVYCLTFDRTGQIVITGADDSLVKCWSAIDGRLIHTFRGSTSEIADMTVSHDNRLLAVGSNDKLIRVYDLQTAAPVAISCRHSSLITAVNFCPKSLSDNSFYLASTARDGCVSFWKFRYNDQNEVVFDETPTRYHERIRPGLAAIICASFSPGGNFFVVGSIDHHVRVYQMDSPEGPQRIFEDDAHTEGVDSVQWCNQPVMRFLSGSRDCTARIWTFSNNKWSSILLDMSLGDDPEKLSKKPPPPSEPVPGTSSGITDGNRGTSRLQASSQSLRPLRAAAAAAASTFAHANYSDDDYLAHQRANERLQAQQSSSRPRVTMVSWTTDDRNVITAVSNFTLKIWKSCDGQLIATLSGHKDEIYVLEPHPVSVNILLTGAHDGQIRVWDLSTFQCIYKHTNNVENQAENSGEASHASVFDAKWSPDGTLISASDSHGQIIFLGHGSSERYDMLPTELFFHTDYRPLLRDSFHNVVDEQTQLPPHLMPPPFLVDSDGAPYSANIQRFAPGREGLSEQEAMLPFGADVGPLAVQDGQEQQNGQAIVQPEIEAGIVQGQHNILPQAENQVQIFEVFANQQRPGPLNIPQPNVGLNLVALANKKNKSVIEINKRRISELSAQETEYYSLHTRRESHNQTSSTSSNRTLKQQKRTSQSTQNRSQPRSWQRPSNNSRSRDQQQIDENDEEEEGNDDEEVDDNIEENQARNSAGEDTSDLSLSESDLSEESSTEESSEHSDWGSDHGVGAKSPTSALTSPPPNAKKKSPKGKKRRRAAQKCRELIQNGSIDNEAFMPSPWLSDTIPRKSPYFPQIGDLLMYFKQGHENYLELVKQRNTYKINLREVQFLKKKSVPEYCLVRIVNLKVEIRPPRLVVLKLAIIDPDTCNPIGDSFTIKYHDMNDVVDFLVLQQTYGTIRGKHWKKGDRIRCQIDDCWWKGTIFKVEPYEDFRRSPFLAIHVHWDNTEKERLSPWDIEALDGDSAQLDDGTAVTPDQISSCLYVPTAEEWNGIGRDSECERISEALQAIMELAIAEPFNYPVDLTVYPEYVVEVEYPVDLTMVKSRVDNRFYRRIDAILFDLKYIYENAASFNLPKSDIVKNAKIIWQTASDIIKSPLKTKDDVSGVYHRMVETFEWSQSDTSDSDDNEQGPSRGRNSRHQKISKKQDLVNPKQWKRDCNDLLDDMFKHPLSDPFREPVSEIEYPDYSRIVSTPMDLTMVRESLHSGEYETPTALQKDVHLIFKNSRTYNTNSKSKVWTMTTRLEEWFDKRMMKLLYEWRKTKRKIAVGHGRIDRTRGKSNRKGEATKSKNRKLSDSESLGSSEKDDDSDDASDGNGDNENEPIPSTSSGLRQPSFSKSRPSTSRQSNYQPNTSDPGPSGMQDSQTDLSQAQGFRRTSSRPHRLPARLSDDIPSTSQGITRGSFHRNADFDDDDDDDDDDEEKPLAVVRAKRQREEIGESSQGGRPKRIVKSKVQNASKESEDVSSGEDNGEKSNDEGEDSEEVVSNSRGQKRKMVKEETVSVKKSRRDEASSDDDEDIPLSSMRRLPLRATFSPQHTISTRPQRAAKKTLKSLAEQSDDDDDDDDEDSPLSKRRRAGRAQTRSEEESKRVVTRRSQRAKGNDSDEEESTGDEEDDTEEEGDDLDDDDEEYGKSSRRRPTRGRASASRPNANGTRRVHHEIDAEDDEEEEEEEDEDDDDDEDDNDLSPPAASKRSSRRRAATKIASKTNNYGRPARRRNTNPYESSDDDGSSERENRRPVRAAAQRNRFTRRNHSDDSSYDDDDEETGVVRKTKVTSRGRVCKPNPRII